MLKKHSYLSILLSHLNEHYTFTTKNYGNVFLVKLTVKAKVLGEGLSAHHLKATVSKVAHRPGVVVQVPRGKPLVGRVKQREQLLALNQVSNLLPLLLQQ